METIKLHSSGQKDHISALKKSYEFLKSKIKKDKTLSSTQKKSELDSLRKSFEKEKKQQAKHNLY